MVKPGKGWAIVVKLGSPQTFALQWRVVWQVLLTGCQEAARILPGVGWGGASVHAPR